MASPERVQFDGLYKQAGILSKMRRYPEAIAYAQRAIAIFPDNPFPYLQIAIAMAYMKDPASSEWARKAISKAPDNGHCWAALSDTFNLQGKWAEGLEPMRKAVALDPDNPRFLSFLGQSLIYLKNHWDAVTCLRKSVELNPRDAEAHYRLHIALAKVRDRKGSQLHLRKALELSPDNAAIQNSLGWRLLGKGRRDEAEEAFREALRLNPQFEPAKVGLGDPAGRKKGLKDALLRYSISVYSLPQRPLLALIQLVVLIGTFGSVNRYPDLWELKVVLVIFAVWYAYFLLAWLIVKVIGKRRGVHFF